MKRFYVRSGKKLSEHLNILGIDLDMNTSLQTNVKY